VIVFADIYVFCFSISVSWSSEIQFGVIYLKTWGRVETESDGTRRCTGGEVKGKEANGVGSHQPSTVSERGLSSITTADAHTSAASSRLNWHPRRYKWTCPFRWKTKSGFCACAITFRFHSSTQPYVAFLTLESCSCLFILAEHTCWIHLHDVSQCLLCLVSSLFSWLVYGACLPCLAFKTLRGEVSLLMWGWLFVITHLDPL